MKVIKKLITYFLLCFIAFIYLYFFTYNIYNSLLNKTFTNNYYIENIHIHEEIFDSVTFENLSNTIYSDAVKYIIYGNNKYDSNYILSLININLDNIKNEIGGNYSKEEIKNDLFLYLTSMYEDITSNNSSINFQNVSQLFSYPVLKIIAISLIISLFLLFILSNDFLWIRNNGIILLLISFCFVIAWYIVGGMLSLGANLLFPKILLSVFDVIYSINFSYCITFFIIGILSLVFYFIFLRLFNIKKS